MANSNVNSADGLHDSAVTPQQIMRTRQVDELLDRLTVLPKVGRPLRDRPRVRACLKEQALELMERFNAPAGEIEWYLRRQLQDLRS